MYHTGRTLSSIDLDAVWGGVGPCLAIGRTELHQVLTAAGPEVRMGVQVEEIDQEGGTATVVFDDGSSADFDLVVGADGLHSSIRALVFGEVAPRPVGQFSWRFLVDGVGRGQDWTVMLGGRRTLLWVPLGGGRVYCYVDVESEDGRDPTGGDTRRLIAVFDDFAQPAGEMIAAGLEGGSLQHGPIEEVVTDAWASGLVVLIGDAAHAMSPNMAQGAAMAFEDAQVLAESLQAHESVREGLAVHLARRLPRVRAVRDRTHRRDRIRSMPAYIRAVSLRAVGRRIYRADYSSVLDPP
jgi:2-polyprenyl-6-methoxyphenol hydroxylase-like FAD-dependent oxidoreductase